MHASIASLTFGSEFEVIVPHHYTRETAARELSRRIGQPVHAHIRPDGTAWKVVNDGSVRGAGTPLEFVSPHNPPLVGDAGLEEVARVANALRDMGALVNATCGYHVHVGVRGETLPFFKTLIRLYGKFEDAIDTIMPRSRRGNAAQFCKSIKLIRSEEIERATTLPQLSHALYRSSGAYAPRYHKVNLEAFQKHTTVEFRQHAGTVDAAKATNWIVTCLRIVAAAKAGKSGEGVAQNIAWDLSRLVGKQKNCAELINRPEGATNEEIRAAFGYRTISARTNLKRAGLSFREGRDPATGKVRFYATGAGEVTSAPILPTLDGLAEVIEADATTREYLAARRAALAPDPTLNQSDT